MTLVLETFSDPLSAFKKIKEDPKISFSLILIVSGWFNFLVSILLLAKTPLSIWQLGPLLISTSLLIVLMLSLKTMWLHFFSEMAGGEGRALTLFAQMGYSLLPIHLSLPLTLIAQKNFQLLLVGSWAGLLLWAKILDFKALQENYNLSPLKAIWVISSPALFLFILAMVSLVCLWAL